MSSAKEADSPEWHDKDFLYTVLNLPTSASQSEIRERHHSLSLIYHPDKLRNADESTRETAKKRFLEVQKAYEVLSDPFLREVYNTLGYEGLCMKLPQHIRNTPLDELPSALYRLHTELHTSQLEARVHARGRVLVGFDVSELLSGGWIWREWYRDLVERLETSGITAFSVRHSFEKELSSQTRITLHGTMTQGAGANVDGAPEMLRNVQALQRVRGNIVANLFHRHSPEFTIAASTPLLRHHRLTLTPTYSDGTNHVAVSTTLSPSSLLYPYPPTNISLSRRLFRNTPTLGTLIFQFNPLLPAALSVALNKPCISSSVARPDGEGSSRTGVSRTLSPKLTPGALPLLPSGFSLSLNLRSHAPGPSIAYEHHIEHPATNLRGKFGFEFSLVGGLAVVLTGEWNNDEETTGLGWAVVFGATGVSTRISISHLGQVVVLPLVLSSYPDSDVFIFATVLPAAAYGLADYFFLRHKRARKRIALRNAQREAHSEHVQKKKREAEDTSRLLKEVARRHVQLEKKNDGLIINEAIYLPLDQNGEPITDLGVNVTDVLQALVHNGQVFIPGNRPKSSIRGFYDPMPDFSKRLCVRYEFRGNKHYVEVEDWDPVVMPMEDHLV